MRTFLLVRGEDKSGVSGTGTVAEGVEWDDGQVSLCWLSKYHIVETIANIHTLEAVHGHAGSTKVEWMDEPKPPTVVKHPSKKGSNHG